MGMLCDVGSMPEPLLRVEGLKKYFPITKGLLFDKAVAWIKAVDDVSFSINGGETFALVGESGCGKSTVAKLILLLLRSDSGSILYCGHKTAHFRRSELREYRFGVRAVFQDPFASLDPRMRVGTIIAEAFKANLALEERKSLKDRVSEVLCKVGLSSADAELFPHEFSGGQRQRIALARALITNPKLVTLDEPVSALDVSIRAQILNLLKKIQGLSGIAYLFISHHLGTVRYLSHRIAVMYLGRIVELGLTEEVFTHPLHPYTEALLSAALPSHPDIRRNEIVLPGEVTSPVNLPHGCHFHPRCFRVQKTCLEGDPPLREDGHTGHWVACHLL